MSIGEPLLNVMPRNHAEALLSASTVLIDEFFEDVVALTKQQYDPDDIRMFAYLPHRYLPRYNFLFAKEFLICVATVAWKLRSAGWHALSCTAEELALAAIIERAETIPETDDVEADFGAFVDAAYQDTDYEFLFNDAEDGIEDTELGHALGIGRMKFDEWFTCFDNTEPVHPYVDPVPEREMDFPPAEPWNDDDDE